MISCFNVRCPSIKEFEDEDIPKLDMTCKSPEWDHAGPDWAEQEASTMDLRGRVHDNENVSLRLVYSLLMLPRNLWGGGGIWLQYFEL